MMPNQYGNIKVCAYRCRPSTKFN